jgi:hypothetical protein
VFCVSCDVNYIHIGDAPNIVSLLGGIPLSERQTLKSLGPALGDRGRRIIIKLAVFYGRHEAARG